MDRTVDDLRTAFVEKHKVVVDIARLDQGFCIDVNQLVSDLPNRDIEMAK